ncbi:hypothetical protein EAG08_21260 [Chryseobacterium sp. 3008163]|nr:hypothetical protein EAG08_21260 [Chryseobacterium sp. 3008163]
MTKDFCFLPGFLTSFLGSEISFLADLKTNYFNAKFAKIFLLLTAFKLAKAFHLAKNTEFFLN